MLTLSSPIVEHEKPGPFEMRHVVLSEESAPEQPFQPIRVFIQNGESGKVPERDYEVSWFAPPPPAVPFISWTELR